MKNLEIAEILNKMADLMEMLEIDWKPRAYRKAARTIENMSKDIRNIYEKGGEKALCEIPSIGKGIAFKIEQYLKKGKIKEFEQLKKKIPQGLEQIMNLPGMGPKKAIKLYKKLKIKNLKQLISAVKKGKIKKLEGFGKKSEKEILRAIELKKQSKGRQLLGVMLPIARKIKNELEKLSYVKRIEIAGSLRRRKETIGDIDLLIRSDKPEKVMGVFTKLPEVKTILAKGKTKSSIVLRLGIQSDLRVLPKESFGAGLQYFTGNKDHNIKLRKIAIKKKYKLSEYGLFKGKKQIAGKTEKETYQKLGMQYIEPELRENTGEIEAAIAKKLPKLIGYDDIKGDLQMHTAWSDGSESIEEMAKAAKKMGYKYIAITDHSKSERIAGGMDEKKLMKCLKAIEKARKKVRGITILKGAEVDILPDGSLDYSDKILKKLDIVVAAVHSRFKMNKNEMTKRICKALENKYVNILAHPTGRLIGERRPYELDLNKVIVTAKKNKVALEINAFPNRLDLNEGQARIAAEKGAKLVISTDAHQTDNLRYMEYSIAVARRGWVKKAQVINTKTLSELKKFLRKHNSTRF